MKSKKRSDTKRGRPPSEPFVYFVDRCLGRGVAAAPTAAQMQVKYQDDLFPQDAEDADWLPPVGQYGWLVLTKVKDIRRTPIEREALIAAKARVFVLAGGGNKTGAENAALIIRHRSQIERVAKKQLPPFVAGVTQTGVRVYEWSVPPGKRAK